MTSSTSPTLRTAKRLVLIKCAAESFHCCFLVLCQHQWNTKETKNTWWGEQQPCSRSIYRNSQECSKCWLIRPIWRQMAVWFKSYMFHIVVTFPAKLILWPRSITGGFQRVRNCEILSAVLAERLQGNTQLLFQTHLRERAREFPHNSFFTVRMLRCEPEDILLFNNKWINILIK